MPRPEAAGFTENLRQSMRRETEMLLESIVREDRSVIDLLNADYTFVDETLAKHYGMPNVRGSRFRRVAVTDEARRGLLGQGSFLLVTSVANRTSPVSRGKWVLENLMGVPPPLPPPNVPAIDESPEAAKASSLRQKMEIHRGNPTCAACHRIMDPIGFTLENFDWSAGGARAMAAPRLMHQPAVRRDSARWSGQSAESTAGALGCVRAHGNREADDVRHRPRAEVLRHAGRPARRSRRSEERLSFLVARARYREERSISDEDEGSRQ